MSVAAGGAGCAPALRPGSGCSGRRAAAPLSRRRSAAPGPPPPPPAPGLARFLRPSRARPGAPRAPLPARRALRPARRAPGRRSYCLMAATPAVAAARLLRRLRLHLLLPPPPPPEPRARRRGGDARARGGLRIPTRPPPRWPAAVTLARRAPAQAPGRRRPSLQRASGPGEGGGPGVLPGLGFPICQRKGALLLASNVRALSRPGRVPRTCSVTLALAGQLPSLSLSFLLCRKAVGGRTACLLGANP
uniref:Formin-like protein 5 n=1 Tax=Castor canadensis TaxID=51338 RepID=A0A8B7V5T0_CASCN|nr:formin-like protein 5 [Castor canadensis]